MAYFSGMTLTSGQSPAMTQTAGSTASAGSSGGGMGGLGAGMAVAAIGSAIQSIYSAKYAKEVSKYNQTIYNIQGGIIEANRKYEKARFAEARKTYMAKGITTLSAQNVGMGRTSLALLNKSMTNLYLDEAQMDYNYSMAAISNQMGAGQAMIAGRGQETAYRTQAISSIAKGATEFSMYQKGVK